MPVKLITLTLLATTLVVTGCSVQQKGSSDNADVKIKTPFGGMKVKTNDAVVASETGLPVYPGATPVKKEGQDDGAADVDMSFGSFHLRVKAISYRTPDSPDKVIAFYRKSMAHYGDVIECKDYRPVGSPTRTAECLTCEDEKDNHVVVTNKQMHSEIELKTGSKTHQHVVSIDAQVDGAKFGLISLDLPKGDKDEKQSN